MTDLKRIVYVSTRSDSFADSDIDAIMNKARKRNSGSGVTGALLYNGVNFIQLLEGEPFFVNNIMDMIRADGRHTGLRVLIDEPTTSQVFSNWAMFHARAPADADDLKEYFPQGAPADIIALFERVARMARA